MAGLGELARVPLHTCELCGQEGLTEPDMRSHMMVQHIESSPSCPFCDLGKTGELSLYCELSLMSRRPVSLRPPAPR